MIRPDHLPDFNDPPLDEVVLGIQFSPAPEYNSTHAGEVWRLFQEEFPDVEEHPLLDPQFETFGGKNVQAGTKVVVGAQPAGSRLWFISEDASHLIQFQPDRLISNWRRRSEVMPYPRFEGLAQSFNEKMAALSQYFDKRFGHAIEINQAEITYVNLIPVEDFSEIREWLDIWSDKRIDVENLNLSFNEVVIGDNGKPFARLRHQVQSVLTGDRRSRAFRFTLTFIGKPQGVDIMCAMQFFRHGRTAIVSRFEEMTTESAHQKWGRVQ